jgi:hypothetical protein
VIRGKVHYYSLLRRSYREGGKVKHQNLGNLSHLPPEIIALIRGALRGERYLPASDTCVISRSRPHGHVAAVLATVRRVGLKEMLASRPSRQRDLAVALIASRILAPGSKLATYRGLQEDTGFNTLRECLALGDLEEHEVYEAMDWLGAHQERIEKKLAARELAEGCLVLYDVTSTYYTGRHCSLAKHGYSRDGRKEPQIVLGLVCTREGCPVAVEVFAGNTGDPKTLGVQLQKLRQRFGLRRVVLVGDRGMLTEARLREEVTPVEGLDWITALRAPAIRGLVEQGALQLSLFDERELAEIMTPDYPGERLIACRNPLLAQERARKREELLEETERELNKIVQATRRDKRPLHGKDRIGLRVGKVLDVRKMGKRFRLTITEEGFSYQREHEKIAAEAALDGIYVIRTSVPAEALSLVEAVRVYKALATVERAFRSLKTVDLHVRPIYHRLEHRVRAHVLLCMLAYYVEWHMRQALAPLLFDDETPQAGEAQRSSVVAPAQRSPEAQHKAQRKETAEGLRVHSFQTLLRDLSTITKNRVQPKAMGPEAAFDIITIPTPLQHRALSLLQASLTA